MQIFNRFGVVWAAIFIIVTILFTAANESTAACPDDLVSKWVPIGHTGEYTEVCIAEQAEDQIAVHNGRILPSCPCQLPTIDVWEPQLPFQPLKGGGCYEDSTPIKDRYNVNFQSTINLNVFSAESSYDFETETGDCIVSVGTCRPLCEYGGIYFQYSQFSDVETAISCALSFKQYGEDELEAECDAALPHFEP